MSLRRRYIARFAIEGDDAPVLVIFQRDDRTCDGVTAFAPDQARYLLVQRAGKLVYRREELARGLRRRRTAGASRVDFEVWRHNSRDKHRMVH